MPLFATSNLGVATTAAATLTAVEISAGASVPVVITEIAVTFDAASAAQGIKVQLGTRTSTSPTTSSLTVTNQRGFVTATATVTAVKYTAEGTSPAYTTDKTYYVPNTGGLVIQYPLGRERGLAVSTKLAIMVVTPTAVNPNCAVNVEWEE